MRYYSLNNSSPLTSFKKAVQNGIAPDRGLYFPEKITPISKDFIKILVIILMKKLHMK